MLRNYISVILLAFIVQVSFSQKYAPVNPAYVKYVDAKNNPNGSIPENYGFIPPYTEYSENGVVNNPSPTGLKRAIKFMPDTFDLREKGMVSSVKNQGTGNSGGNCWAFSTMGAIESQWLMKGLGEADLSEQNISACHGFYYAYGAGGNEFVAGGYITNLKGPIKDSDDPYNTNIHNCKSGLKPFAYVPEIRFVYKNMAMTKKLLMEYGAVTTRIFWRDEYLNSQNNTYYSLKDTSPNHAVLIVGWNNNIETKGGTGAWIVKNSWGPSWAENGFFYVSFNDPQMINPITYFPVRLETKTIDNKYGYFSAGLITNMGDDQPTEYALLKVSPVKPQILTKINTFALRTGTIIEVDIFNDFVNDTLENLISSFTFEPVRSPGNYTFNIPTKVYDEVFVRVKYTTPEYGYPIPVERKIEKMADPFIYPKGSQWISNDGVKWQPLGSDVKNYESNIIANVYASNDTTNPRADFKMDKQDVCRGSSVTFTNNSFDTITTYRWHFGDYATPKDTVGKGPITVKIADQAPLGVTVASLFVEGPNGTDSIIKEYSVVENLVLVTSTPDRIKPGDTVTFTAYADASLYAWYPSDMLDNNNTNKVVFTPDKVGKYKYSVHAAQGNCYGNATIEVNVAEPPVNDEPCKAITLVYGSNGPFSNKNATFKPNEPHPVDTSCFAPMTWCDEGGLQNSVWFKFIAPASGKVGIDTRDMDTQIALYKSEKCDSIEFQDLVAANDDYYTSAPYSAAFESVDVEAGKTYYLQVDGSGGGTEGDFSIFFSNTGVNIKRVSNSQSNLEIFPNPNAGIFELKYTSPWNENIAMEIYDVTGKIVDTKTFLKRTGDFSSKVDASHLLKGMYMVKVKGKKSVTTAKFILE